MIDFAARNLTSNAGFFLLLENAKADGVFELIDTDLAFENESAHKIKMDHIKTILHHCSDQDVLAGDFSEKAVTICRAIKPFLNYLDDVLQ